MTEQDKPQMNEREQAVAQVERNRIVRWLEAEQESVAQSIRDNVKDGPDSSVWWTLGAIAKSIRNGDHLKDRPMTDKPELKPCQTCDDDEPFIDSCGAFGRAWFAGTCGRCHYSTATFPTQADAIAAWNTRATPSQPDASALVEAIVEAALDVANIVSHDGYYEIDRDAAVRAALSAWEAQHG